MNYRLRTIWTIARRDYVAIVFSRLFLLFLAVPAVAGAVGAAFAAIDPGPAPPPPAAPIVVALPSVDAAAVVAARDRLAAAFGEDALPAIVRGGSRGDAAVLSGTLAAPRIAVPAASRPGLAGAIGRLVVEARRGPLPVPHAIVRTTAHAAPPHTETTLAVAGRDELGGAAQYALFLFTIGLAGRLLANFIEERGNKVIELLVAAVPVEAIFYGKLLAMLLFSFTCIAAWLGGAAAATAIAAPGLLAGLATPVIGWAGFVAAGGVHFALGYLLIGTIMLGLGAQTRTPADVQTLALPLTLAQLGLFGLARAGVAHPGGAAEAIALALPWSTSLVMAARAATDPRWWPQLAAIAWQAGWLVLSVRIASVRFRRAVLACGPVRIRRGG